MFKVFRLKSVMITLFLCILTILLSVGFVTISTTEVPKSTITIVVDAGHGGRDDGCTGINGTKESEINLKISKCLKTYLETLGVNVVMTRSDGNGLYESNVDNYKLSDMEARLKIINNAKPDMIISIHQNSFHDSSQCGAQAFYQENDEISLGFAESVQSQLISQLSSARSSANKGDYYLLKECDLPAIIVECGYLSNEEDERMLSLGEYQEKVAYAIMCGVVKYFNICGND